MFAHQQSKCVIIISNAFKIVLSRRESAVMRFGTCCSMPSHIGILMEDVLIRSRSPAPTYSDSIIISPAVVRSIKVRIKLEVNQSPITKPQSYEIVSDR